MNRVRAVCLAAACVALAGCGAEGFGQTPSGGNAAQSTSAAPSAPSSDCLLGANDADVEVGIGNPTQSCAQWITDLAGSGLAWQPIGQMVPPDSPGTADGETMGQACDLTDGTQELYIEDAGGMSYGDSICSQEEQNGWTPESSPGPLAVLEQQQARAAAGASASASAAASQAQSVSGAQSSLANDVSALSSDTATLNNDTSLASDISQMKQDYGQEQSDYQTEQQQGSCSDGSMGADASEVSADASSVDADLSSLQADIQALQINDINSVQTDLSNVAGDLSTLQGLGAAPGTPSSAAVAAGHKALTSAASAISWAKGQGQKINAEAQALATTAQNYASSHCG